MNDASIRNALSSMSGMVDYTNATLSRVEHGPDREIVTKARERLKIISAEILMLRARLAPRSTPSTVSLERVAVSVRAEH